MKALLLAIPVVVASLLNAQAEDKTIKLKLVTKFIEKSGDGAQVFGVTFQQNGTVGRKDFFIKPAAKKGEFVGLSTYTFEDGSITASFTGEEVEKGHNKGSYIILGGSGIYEGAKGGGSFEGTPADSNPVKGIGVYDVTLNVTTPPRN
jgi:hypothetical protein